MKSTVSVCIPAYRGEHLEKAIDSVLNQTKFINELIVVNDNSPDNLDKILANYSETNIKYMKNTQNLGVPHIYNYLLRQATSDYVMIFGDHDILEHSFIERCAQLLDRAPDVDIVFTASKAIDEYDQVITEYTKDRFPEIFPGNLLVKLLVTRMASPITYDTLIRREELLKNNIWFDPKYWWFGDIDLWIRLASDKSVGYINEYLLLRRRREEDHYLNDKLWRSQIICDQIRMNNWMLAFPENNFESKIERARYEYRKNILLLKLVASLRAKSDNSADSVLPSKVKYIFHPFAYLFAQIFASLPSSIFRKMVAMYQMIGIHPR